MLKDLLAKWKSAWLLQAAFVTFLVPIVGQLVASPPTLWREAGQQPAFATFLITVVVAFLACSVMAGIQPALRSTIIWLVPAAVVFMVAYFPLRAHFSCPFADDRMSIGWTYLPIAAEYVAKNPGQDCGLLNR
jgi:quinol-cytochrome oxidoreductase complex cytochrome b subunit